MLSTVVSGNEAQRENTQHTILYKHFLNHLYEGVGAGRPTHLIYFYEMSMNHSLPSHVKKALE